MREEGEVLEDHSQLTFIAGNLGHVLAIDENPPFVRYVVTGDATQCCGLAAA